MSNWDTAYGWGDHSSEGYLTAHPNISAASSSDNSGRTYIQDITLDSNGHVTGITTATETVTNTNTQLSNEQVQDIVGAMFTGNTETNITATYQDADGTIDLVSTNTTYSVGDGGLTEKNFTTELNDKLDNIADGADVTPSWVPASDPNYLTAHPSITEAADVNNSNGTVIQDLTFDNNGHVTATGSANLDDRYYTETEMKTFFERGYIVSQNATNLAAGWYTIAQNTGDRALGEFQIWDTASSRHQSVIFNAAHHYGEDDSNSITVFANSSYGTDVFRYIRIKENGTYDGAALQIYIDNGTNAVHVAIIGGNAQANGWELVDWLADATAPSQISNWSSATEASRIDLDNIHSGGIATTGKIYSGGATTQYEVLNTNSAVNASKITSGTLPIARIADDAITGAKIAHNTLDAIHINASAIGASELNVSGNGTTSQFLRSDGDGTFSWATPTDTNTTYSVGDGGLTQKNFTTTLKNKLDGIASGAEVNVQSDWNATSGDALILNKPTIPTNNNQLTNGAGYITSVPTTLSGNRTIGGDLTVSGNQVITAGSNADVKFSVWSGTTYGIGMTSGVTYGGLNDYAMTFCMNNDSDRGFWWGYSGQSKSSGAMSLTTGGNLTLAGNASISGTISASGYNDSNWNTAYGWGNHASAGYLTAHPNISAASSVNNSGRTYIQDITLDSNGHITAITSATETVTNTDTQLTNEQVQDIVGAMFTGNTETNITATYQDSDGTIDLVATNTTYSVGDGGLTQKNFTTTLKNKLDGIEASADVTDTTNVVAALTAGTNITIAANGTISSTDTNTTYSVGDGGLTQKNFTTTLKTKLDGIATSADNYGDWKFVDNADSATDIRSANYVKFDGADIAGSGTQGDPYVVTTQDTNTTYTADGNYGMTLNGTAFRLENDRRRNSTSTDIYTGNTHDYTFYDASVGIRWYTAGAEEMRLEDDGDLHVDGDVIAFSTTVSDARLKDDVETIENATEKIKQLRGVSYTWNNGSREGQREIGVIAQEVEEVVPEIVHEKKLLFAGDEVYKTVDYEKLVALLIESNKEQQDIIAQLEERIIDLENRL